MKNNFDLNQIEVEINQKTTIKDRLDYWKEIKNKFIDEPLKTVGNVINENELLLKLLGKGISIISPLYIPEKIYNEYFKDSENNPEFTSWFLKYHAKNYFESEKIIKGWDEKINSPIAVQLMQAELKTLDDFEIGANELLLNNRIDIYSYSNISFAKFNNPYYREIEFLRIKGKYYETRPLENVDAKGNVIIEIYAKHIFLKEYLENNLRKVLPPQLIERPTNTPLYLIKDTNIILNLFNKFNDVIFNGITEGEFLNCFDVANTPRHYPTYINQNNFIAMLKEITIEAGAIQNVSPGIALTHFGVKNYSQLKNKLSNTGFQSKISTETMAILKPNAKLN